MANARPTPTAKARQLGKRIAFAREQKGYSQTDVAVKLGVTKGAVGQYEIAATTPKAKRLEALAGILGVTVAWLLTGDEPEEVVRAQTVSEMDALNMLRAMSPEEQAAALAMMRGLTGKKTRD